ncbi:MAG: hypothetical protein ACRD20_13315 [Terriglobales bacterium]
MAISAGDVVLTFVADMTQLDAAFNKVATETGAKIQPAGAAIDAVGKSTRNFGADLDATGENVAFAGEKITELGKTGEHSFGSLRTQIGLVDNTIRGNFTNALADVTRALSSMGLVAQGLNFAASVAGLILLVELVSKITAEIEEYAHHADEVAAAWEKVDNVQRKALESLEENLIRAQIKVDELTGKHLEALRLKLELIDHASLQGLAAALDKIAQEADKAFLAMDRNWLAKFFASSEGSAAAKGEFDKLSKSIQDALTTRTPKAFADAMTLVDDQIKKADEQLGKLEQKQKDFKPFVVGGTFQAPGPDPTEIHAWEELKQRVEAYKVAIQEAQKAEEQEKKAAGIEDRKKAEQDASRAAEAAFKIYKDIFVARQAMEKELEKQASGDAKIDESRLKEQLKLEDDAAKHHLEMLRQQEQAAQAVLDGEIKAEEDADNRKAELLRMQYDKGLTGGQQYLAKLKALYVSDVQALIQILNRKQEIVILEAQNEAARRGQILTAEQAKELKGYIDLENKKKQVTDSFNNKLLQAEDNLAKKQAKILSTRPQWDKFFQDLAKGALTTGEAFKTLGLNIEGSIAQSVEAAIMGSESFGRAMEGILKSALASLAGVAVVRVLEEIAKAMSDFAMAATMAADPFTAALAPGFIAAANAHLAAAAKWGVIGGGAAVVGAAIPGSGGSSSAATAASSKSGTSADSAPATQPAQNPVQTVNVAHLASGGLVDRPTLALMIGDSAGGGRQREPVIPLNDPAAHSRTGGGDLYITIEPGMNMQKTVKKISRDVNAGKLRLKASDSLRTTRRY